MQIQQKMIKQIAASTVSFHRQYWHLIGASLIFMIIAQRAVFRLLLGTQLNLSTTTQSIMSKLDQVSDIDIDDKGKFKYILINIKDLETKTEKNIVRGYKDCPFHVDILEKVEPEIIKLGLKTKCLGGGRIKHDPVSKSLLIYGYSQGFGRADHTIAQEVCKKKFPDYKDVSWTNEGY